MGRQSSKFAGVGHHDLDEEKSEGAGHHARDSIVEVLMATSVKKLRSEDVNEAIIDTGCTNTVCGAEWLAMYLEGLSKEEKDLCRVEKSEKKLRFGGGELLKSTGLQSIPATFGKKQVVIKTDVVESPGLRLLLSLRMLKRAGTVLNIADDTAIILGQKIQLKLDRDGHYVLKMKENVEEVMVCLSLDDPDRWQDGLEKLHKQFGHPPKEKLVDMIKTGRKWRKDADDGGVTA